MPQLSTTQTIGSPFVELQSIDSTNNYARQLIHAGLAQHGMAVFSHEQVAGKGQRGKIWASEKDKNIAISLVIKPSPLKITQPFQLSACIAIAVHDFFKKYAGDDSKIKWPNDLYWQDRKAGGILIENIIGGQWDWSIIGIGINLNQTLFAPNLPNPVSLKQITGKEFNVLKLAEELCISLDKRYKELVSAGFDSIFTQYLLQLYKLNETVKLKTESRVFEGVITGVSPTGKLIVRHAIEEEFDFGKVEWLI